MHHGDLSAAFIQPCTLGPQYYEHPPGCCPAGAADSVGGPLRASVPPPALPVALSPPDSHISRLHTHEMLPTALRKPMQSSPALLRAHAHYRQDMPARRERKELTTCEQRVGARPPASALQPRATYRDALLLLCCQQRRQLPICFLELPLCARSLLEEPLDLVAQLLLCCNSEKSNRERRSQRLCLCLCV